MAKYKITINENECIGCGACTSVCSNFELVEKKGAFKAKAKKSEVDALGCNEEAKKICPVGAIRIDEKKK